MLALIAGVAAVAAIGLRRDDSVGQAARRHPARQPLRRLRVPRPLQAVRGVAPGVTIKEEIQELRGPPHASSRSTSRPAQALRTSRRSRSGSSRSSPPQPQNFVDLRKYGADAIKSRWLPWKYQQAVGKGGAVVGLGTDVGSLAICYRKDLFAKAGLPTNRVAVSKLWPTWQAYINTGKRYQAKAPKGTFFFDSGSNVYNAMVGQLNPAYYNAAGKLIAATNPSVKAAYNLAISGWQAGEDAGLAAFTTDWNTGYKKGMFATVTCPAWMMGYIQGQAPATKGKWDIAADARHGRQLGRLVPRRPEAVVAPGRGGRPGQVPDLARLRGVRLQADGQPAEPAGAAEEPGRAELQEPVLQQRAGRQDLRQLGAAAEAADPRPAPG